MAASFTIGVTSVPMKERIVGFRRIAGELEEIHLSFRLAGDTDWNSLVSLRTAIFNIETMYGGSPPGSTTYVDVLAGAGQGTLVIDNLGSGSFTAILDGKSLQVDQVLSGGRRLCSARFILIPS
jgi:hypothetical protein